RYASLEDLIDRRRLMYLKALQVSDVGWEDSRHDLYPWAEFVVQIVSAGYEESRRNVSRLLATARRLREIATVVDQMPDRFTSAELCRRLPEPEAPLANMLLARWCERGRIHVEQDEGLATFCRSL